MRYEGEYYRTINLLEDEEFNFPVPWWQKKLLKFRLIQSERPQVCHW